MMETIKGHPSIQAYPEQGEAIEITVCANCEAVRSILILVGDRWYCTKCKNSGDAKPQQVKFTNPRNR